ncbi:uncharacterized protein [Henckelia pumila]|uniref:uncharacterized protein n=1 Tax=Henckelia pumila TaxID=405737 RepID=UPI003C6E8427
MGEDKWIFISDRQKGLIEALKELVPDCEHRYCLRHMYQNFKKKFKSLELKDLFWKAATTGNKNQFEEHLKKIAQVDPKLNESQETACEWLKKIPPVHWARSHFSSQCLSDYVVNNLSESFNSYIIDARDKPIITMLECLRNKLMKRIQEKKAGEHEYQIQCLSVHGVLTQHVVDLVKKTCTCGMFQLCGYLCSHACTAIGHNRLKLEDFVHNCYSKDAYLKVYSHMIHAVPGESDYCKTPYQQLNAPIYKSKKGRPQRMRRRQADEETSVSTRRGLTHTCSRCLEQSHNKATCKNPIHPRFKYFKDLDNASRKVQMSHLNRATTNACESITASSSTRVTGDAAAKATTSATEKITSSSQGTRSSACVAKTTSSSAAANTTSLTLERWGL